MHKDRETRQREALVRILDEIKSLRAMGIAWQQRPEYQRLLAIKQREVKNLMQKLGVEQ